MEREDSGCLGWLEVAGYVEMKQSIEERWRIKPWDTRTDRSADRTEARKHRDALPSFQKQVFRLGGNVTENKNRTELCKEFQSRFLL